MANKARAGCSSPRQSANDIDSLPGAGLLAHEQPRF